MEESHKNMVKFLKTSPIRKQNLAVTKKLAKRLLEKTKTTDHNLRIEEEEVNNQDTDQEDDIQSND
jgi:hypothetical protein